MNKLLLVAFFLSPSTGMGADGFCVDIPNGPWLCGAPNIKECIDVAKMTGGSCTPHHINAGDEVRLLTGDRWCSYDRKGTIVCTYPDRRACESVRGPGGTRLACFPNPLFKTLTASSVLQDL